MGDKSQFVFDANSLVSAALFPESTPGRALRLALTTGAILLSEGSIAELRDVLSRPKFDRYLTREERDVFLTKLIQRGVLVAVNESVQICRDPDDNKYLELAIAGEASCIVSGDQDLLEIKTFRGIAVYSPAEFLAEHQKG